ncbi:MAG: hypothetical protein ACLFPX_08525 [Candidatus Omnitrophota bacterium]
MRRLFRKKLSCLFTAAVILQGTLFIPLPQVSAQTAAVGISQLNLPVPGTMVAPSDAFMPVTVKGVKFLPDHPLRLEFILYTGDSEPAEEALTEATRTLVKYFLASLTVPEKDMWVNLSPHEQDRIVPQKFGVTAMGRDVLAQDYVLKQLAASLLHPEKPLGKAFWSDIRKKAQEQLGITDIPVDIFSKVWILPSKAVVYEHGDAGFVVRADLKVMLEKDYLSLKKQQAAGAPAEAEKIAGSAELYSSLMRDIILPAVEQEVNEGRHFAPLRQVYHSLILASWFKQRVREGFLGRVYVDQNKVRGVDVDDKRIKDQIYERYITAFKKGVYNFIREEVDPVSRQIIPRKYFSGGVEFSNFSGIDGVLEVTRDSADASLLARSYIEDPGRWKQAPVNLRPEADDRGDADADEAMIGDDQEEGARSLVWQDLVLDEFETMVIPAEDARNVPAEIMAVFEAAKDPRFRELNVPLVLTGGTARDFVAYTRPAVIQQGEKGLYSVSTDIDAAIPARPGELMNTFAYELLEELLKEKFRALGYTEKFFQTFDLDPLSGVRTGETHVFQNFMTGIDHGVAFNVSKLAVAQNEQGDFVVFGLPQAIKDINDLTLDIWLSEGQTPGRSMTAKMIGKSAIYAEAAGFSLTPSARDLLVQDIESAADSPEDVSAFMRSVLRHSARQGEDPVRLQARVEGVIEQFDLTRRFGRSQAVLTALALGQDVTPGESGLESASVRDGQEQEDTVGGIDLDPALWELEVVADPRNDIPVFNPVFLNNIPIDGFSPIIINISPAADMLLLLGARSEPPDRT